jgi:CDP-diacylglycerol--glycerol-3-phosphate 3-phosphatidyltransferase
MEGKKQRNKIMWDGIFLYPFSITNIADLLSVIRFVTSPLLLVLGIIKSKNLFLTLYIFLMSTDLIDGFIARLQNKTSPQGAQLDSAADIIMYSCFVTGAWLIWPEIIKRELLSSIIVVIAYAIPLFAGIIKFRRIPSYHTWGAKISAVGLGITFILLFGMNIRWTLSIFVPLFVLTAIEELIITLILPEWHANIPSLWHALKIVQKNKQYSLQS